MGTDNKLNYELAFSKIDKRLNEPESPFLDLQFPFCN